jgi:pimeloyl-ACP methyl ester carboxylesterase/DNA-binding CsgD family transcriptional regulator
MDAPPVQYVKTSDGYDIAYAVSGTGTPLIWPSTVGNVETEWDHSFTREWLPALSEKFRLIQLDHRGHGLSSRDLPDALSAGAAVSDIESVVDLLRLDRFVLYGTLEATGNAVGYAVKHPDRVLALVLANVATTYRGGAVLSGLAADDWDLFVHTVYTGASGTRGDSFTAELERNEAIFKQAHDQKNFLLRSEAAMRLPIGDSLERLNTPTLILHSRDFGFLPPDEPMKAARLAKATLVSIDGWSAWGDVEQGVRAIEKFVTELSRTDQPEKVLEGTLSDRELEVLRLLAQGNSNPEIAKALFITRNTVQNHVSSILVKLNVQNRAQAAVYAKEHGLV